MLYKKLLCLLYRRQYNKFYLKQTDIFAKEIGISGIVITKLDGSAKGGVILEIADQFDVAIRFVGVGENAEDLSVFEPGQFTENLLLLESGE